MPLTSWNSSTATRNVAASMARNIPSTVGPMLERYVFVIIDVGSSAIIVSQCVLIVVWLGLRLCVQWSRE